MQIPSRHRCKSTHTTLSCLLSPPMVVVMVNLPPRFRESRVHGVDMRVLGTAIRTPHRDKCSFVSGMAKVPSPATRPSRGNEVYSDLEHSNRSSFPTFSSSRVCKIMLEERMEKDNYINSFLFVINFQIRNRILYMAGIRFSLNEGKDRLPRNFIAPVSRILFKPSVQTIRWSRS